MQKNKMSKSIEQFSRFAEQYDRYNTIQAEVAKILVSKVPKKKYVSILDIGCGRGEIYNNIKKSKIAFGKFIALDASKEMLALHPSHETIEKVCADFNILETYKKLDLVRDDTLLISSSALQWSKDLDFTLAQLAKKSSNAYFAIFTSNTFKTLHQIAKVQSPIYSEAILKEKIEKYYDANFELQTFKLAFKTVREMLIYIKKSGVSGGGKQLRFKQTKQLIDSYYLDYLEFEILFVEGTSLTI